MNQHAGTRHGLTVGRARHHPNGLEPEEDIGDQSMWEYLREKALRERRAKQDIAEGAAVEVAEKQDEEITEGHTNP